MKKDQDDRIAEFYDQLWENHPQTPQNLIDRFRVGSPLFRIVAEAIEFGYKLGKEDK